MSVVSKHNSGFFSCCSVKLDNIVNFINSHNCLPKIVDSSQQFAWYKINKSSDITYDYFEDYNNIDIILDNLTIDYKENYQFYNYNTLHYKDICPVVKKYFTPSSEIRTIITNIEGKYNINYSNICVLFYRGNDKNIETKICGYEEYINKANLIIDKNPNIQFLIQSDETQFIEKFLLLFPNNSFYFKDEIRHMNKCNSTVDIVMKDKNYIFSKYYLAITIIMSKCKYIVCGSGNCSIWIMLYRGNNKDVYQNLDNQWV
jgi:hypothetical protein